MSRSPVQSRTKSISLSATFLDRPLLKSPLKQTPPPFFDLKRMDNNKQFQEQQPSFQHLMQQQQQKIQMFLSHQRQEIEQMNDFKNHQLPLARIKKIMKADEDVRMISAEAPILFSKACELFILELTIRSWLHAEENKRRTLQKNDISAAITRTDIFDFLVDIVPRDEFKEDDASAATRVSMMDPAAGIYVHHQPSQAWQSVWQTDDGSYVGGPGDDDDQQGHLDGLGYVDHPSDSL